MKISLCHTWQLLMLLALIPGCKSEEKQLRTAGNDAIEENLEDKEENTPPGIRVAGDRSSDEIICQEGVYVTALAKTQNFTNLFNIICENGATNTLFSELINNAYKGEGDPQINALSTDLSKENHITLITASAVYLPNKSPMDLSKINVYQIFAEGVNERNTFININVESITEFPGNKSTRETILNYDLTNANGAGISDKRKTAINSYALLEGYEEATITTEHLLNPNENHYYARTNGLTINYKNPEGGMYLIMISELIMTNRMDPERMILTTSDIHKGSNRIIYDRLTNP